MNQIKFADLYCGAGGLSLGLIRSGFIPALAVDYWVLAKNNYTNYHQLSNTPFIQTDLLFKNNVYDIASKISKDNICLLAGGPPCQGFSTLGKRQNLDTRNALVDSFLEIAKLSTPKYIIMENVPGLGSMIHKQSGEKYPAYIKSFLTNIGAGYTTLSVRLDGVMYGLAQTRKRLFFVSVRKDQFNRAHSEANFVKSFEVALQSMTVERLKVVKDVIYDLPRLESGEGEEKIGFVGGNPIYDHNVFVHSDEVLKRISFVREGGGLQDIPDEYLSKHLVKMKHGGYGSSGFKKNLYGRLVWDKPASTIVAGIKKITCGRLLHPENDRMLTVRECARLQDLPDDYKLSGTFIEKYTLVGNAVPPLFGEVLGNALIEALQPIVSSNDECLAV